MYPPKSGWAVTCESRNSSELQTFGVLFFELKQVFKLYPTHFTQFLFHQYSCTANNCKDSGIQDVSFNSLLAASVLNQKQSIARSLNQSNSFKKHQGHTPKENHRTASTERANSFLFEGGFNFLPPTLLQHFRTSYSKCGSYQQHILLCGFVVKLVWILCCTLQYLEHF